MGKLEEFNVDILKAGRVYNVTDVRGVVRPRCLISSDKFEPYPKDGHNKLVFAPITCQEEMIKQFWTLPILNNGEVSVIASNPYTISMKTLAEKIVGNSHIFELDAYVIDLLTRVMGRVYYDLTKSDYIDLANELHEYQIRIADQASYVHMKLTRTSIYDDDSKFDKDTNRRIDFTPVTYVAPDIPEYLKGFISEYTIMDVRHREQIISDKQPVKTSEPINPVIKDASLFDLIDHSNDDSSIVEKSESIKEYIDDIPENPKLIDSDDDLIPMALKFVSNYDLDKDVRDMSLSSITGLMNDMMLAKSLTDFGKVVGRTPGNIVSKMETASKVLIDNEVSFRYIPRRSTSEIIEYIGSFSRYAGSKDDRIRSIIRDAYKMYLIDIVMKYDIRTNDELRSIIETIRQRVEKNPEKMKKLAEKNPVILPQQVRLWTDTQIINFNIDFNTMLKQDMLKKYGFQNNQNLIVKMNSVNTEMKKRKLVTGGYKNDKVISFA